MIRPRLKVETKLLNRGLGAPSIRSKNTHDEYESEYSLSEYSLSEYSLPDSSPSLRGGVNLFSGRLCITEKKVILICMKSNKIFNLLVKKRLNNFINIIKKRLMLILQSYISQKYKMMF